MPLKQMRVKLLSINHVAHLLYPPLKPPFSNWYKPEPTCEYSDGNPCHSIDTFSTFKRKLLELFKAGWITFEDAPNINSNPLPNHASNSG